MTNSNISSLLEHFEKGMNKKEYKKLLETAPWKLDEADETLRCIIQDAVGLQDQLRRFKSIFNGIVSMSEDDKHREVFIKKTIELINTAKYHLLRLKSFESNL